MTQKFRTVAARCTIHGSDLRCLNCGQFYTMALPASMKMVAAMSKAFANEHRGCKPTAAGDARFEFKTPEQWLNSWDTGQSSLTIWHFMMGRPFAHNSIPRDPADFGRCYRLLKALPLWRERLPEMANALPAWAPIILMWPELERLYEEESPSGTCPKLLEAMARFW